MCVYIYYVCFDYIDILIDTTIFIIILNVYNTPIHKEKEEMVKGDVDISYKTWTNLAYELYLLFIVPQMSLSHNPTTICFKLCLFLSLFIVCH